MKNAFLCTKSLNLYLLKHQIKHWVVSNTFKTSPCIVNLNDKQVNFKHLLFKTSGI